jgi:lysophospholipase L1-like esterase
MNRRNAMRLAAWLVFPILSVMLGGCEGGGGSSAPAHDFGSNDPNVVACLGDSITEGYLLASADSYPSQLAAMTGKTVHNRGVGGTRSSYGVSIVGSVLARYKPGYMPILYGINDLIHGVSKNEIIGNLRTMIQAAKANSTVPIIATLTPCYASHAWIEGDDMALNGLIRTLADEEGVDCADLEAEFGSDESLILPDGLHPNAAGAAVIAQTFAVYMD